MVMIVDDLEDSDDGWCRLSWYYDDVRWGSMNKMMLDDHYDNYDD